MKVTDDTRRRLSRRRTISAWKKEGFEDLGEHGNKLWEIYRGFRRGQVILEARIDPDGMSVWVKIGKPND